MLALYSALILNICDLHSNVPNILDGFPLLIKIANIKSLTS